MHPATKPSRFASLASALVLCALSLALSAAPASAFTAAPTLLSPASSQASSTPLAVSYELPEAALPGSLTLTFTSGLSHTTVSLDSTAGSEGEHAFDLNLHDFTASPKVSGVEPKNTLPDGIYAITLTYQNTHGDPAASTTATNVEVRTATQAPSLTAPTSGSVFDSAFNVTYSLPEAATAGSVELRFEGKDHGLQTITLENTEAGSHTVSINPLEPGASAGVLSAPENLPIDVYEVTVAYEDALENPIAGSAATTIRITREPLCEAGSYSLSGEAPCTQAPAGHYSEGEGATEATACSAGSYDPSAGSTSSAECVIDEPGHYSGPGSSAQTECDAGTYDPEEGSSSSMECVTDDPGHYSASGAGEQTECEAGRYAPATDSIMCRPAEPGHYAPAKGASAEVECEAGTYSDVSGSTVCVPTPMGFYAGAGAALATSCPSGTSDPHTHSVSAAACEPDPPGSWSSSGAAHPTLCEPGTFAAASGSSECASAAAGSYVEATGASAETPCPAGTFASGARAVSCTTTPAGTYATGGATAPTQCPQGTEAPAGASACKAIPTTPITITTGGGTTTSTGGATTSTGATNTGTTPPGATFAISPPVKQTSLLHSRTQRYTLHCSATATVSAHVSVVIAVGHKHLLLAAAAQTVRCSAAGVTNVTARFKLTNKARRLLAARHATVRLLVSLYPTTPASKTAIATGTVRGKG